MVYGGGHYKDLGLPTKWDLRWIEMARLVASWSKDPSTKVGAVAISVPDKRVLSLGYNGPPRGINDDKGERWERPTKYLFVEHAERNCIYNASRSGTNLMSAAMYITLPPCADCARAIIQAGIKSVYHEAAGPELLERLGETLATGTLLLNEARVNVGVWVNPQ